MWYSGAGVGRGEYAIIIKHGPDFYSTYGHNSAALVSEGDCVFAGQPIAENLGPYISPFGTLFVQMLKMIVIPVIFFSLVVGTASLPITKFGRVGLKTVGWYFSTSIFAAVAGIFLALLFNPGAGTDLVAREVADDGVVERRPEDRRQRSLDALGLVARDESRRRAQQGHGLG